MFVNEKTKITTKKTTKMMHRTKYDLLRTEKNL